MVSWKKSGMALGELVEEYVNRERSLLQICAEWGISPGAAGAGAMSTTLKQAGYTVRSSTDASTARKRVVQGNMEERLGIKWGELVEWYLARKSFGALCAKHGISGQHSATLRRLLLDGGVLTDDPLRGFGFNQGELVKMYVDERMSILAIRTRFGLSRHGGTVISSILAELGLSRWKSANAGPGRFIASDGYVRVRVTKDNKHLTRIRLGGSEMEHRLVVATSLGRPLQTREHVHHINRNTADNRLINLMLLDRAKHRRVHVSVDEIIKELFESGRADMTEDGMYKLKESDDYTRGFSDGIEAMLEIG